MLDVARAGWRPALRFRRWRAGWTFGRARRRRRLRLTPARSLFAGFASLTLVGTFLLHLPIASSSGAAQPLLDSLFTATSAVTTTGLVVVDTGSYYSSFGQIVVLILFQIGGLGYMVLIAAAAGAMGRKLSLRAGLAMQDSIAGFDGAAGHAFVRAILAYTLLFEALGAFVLSLHFAATLPPGRAVYVGVFHAVSAFCTAGFSLFSDSFTASRTSLAANTTVAVVTFAGAAGFFVLRDLAGYAGRLVRGRRPRRLSAHTRLALALSVALPAAGIAILVVSEPDGLLGTGVGDRLAAASFQALSASTTTGFNSIDIGAMAPVSLFALMLLMFVGASPGGTGGGVKTTTIGVLAVASITVVRGDEDPVAFGRRVSQTTVLRALAIALLATGLVAVETVVLSATEQRPLLPTAFEVVSALGTVGLSMGMTGGLSAAGKVLISITMLVGRLGPLTIGFALLARPRAALVRHPEERVFVG